MTSSHFLCLYICCLAFPVYTYCTICSYTSMWLFPTFSSHQVGFACPTPLPQFTESSQQPLQAPASSFPTIIPSSDSVTEDNQPIYPTIPAWFEELDYGTGHGSTGYNFSSFVEAFDKDGIKSLHHLFDPNLSPNGLTLEALRDYVESLSPGAAAALIKYARRDKRKYKGRNQTSV